MFFLNKSITKSIPVSNDQFQGGQFQRQRQLQDILSMTQDPGLILCRLAVPVVRWLSFEIRSRFSVVLHIQSESKKKWH